MDFKLETLGATASLTGIVITLRRLYRLSFDVPDGIGAALDDIHVNEQRALTRIASMSQARRSAPRPSCETD